ncbi:hypothetical protein GOV11_00115 [Candidatus Woesearchaeota archaeon]|nr:hypothetical protein [Candidatus Woesearchaeota archaeon]
MKRSTNSARLGNKGQLQHTFAFLMAVLVIIATVVLAVRLLGVFSDTACEASIGEFFSTLDHELTAKGAYGSRGTLELGTPCNAFQVCFVDTRDIDDKALVDIDYVEIQIAIQEGVKENIFLIGEEGVMESNYDGRIVLSSLEIPRMDPPRRTLCINDVRGFTMRTEGFGRYIRVTQ